MSQMTARTRRIYNRVQRARFFDEAFASYFQTLAVRKFEGEPAYRKELDEYRDIFIERGNRNPLGKTTPIADYGKQELGVFSYSKGAWSLYVLHELVGEEKFREIMRTFLSEFGEKPADFKALPRGRTWMVRFAVSTSSTWRRWASPARSPE